MLLTGYSGVAIYVRTATCAPIRAEEGITGILCPPRCTTKFRDLPDDQRIGGYPRPGQLFGTVDELELDSEGRCVILEFPAFVLLGVYSPANRNDVRHEFQIAFLEALDVRVRNLIASGKQVILTGDLNVIRSEVDSTNVAESLRKEGVTLQEWREFPSRRLFNHLVFDGNVSGKRDEGRESPALWDLCRCFHPDREGMNTCWDTKRNTRPANNGSRIDYVLCSDGLKSWFTHADIQEGLMGSDHCPVFAVMADTVVSGAKDAALADIVNPPGMFTNGQRTREWSQQDTLPLSARLIPEFDRRQSIRDMFFRKSESAANQSSMLENPSITQRRGIHQSPKPIVSPNLGPQQRPVSITADYIPKKRTEGPRVLNLQSPSPHKRPSVLTSAARSSKRPRHASDKNSLPDSGQRTLRGFFKPMGPTTEAFGEESMGLHEPDAAKGDAKVADDLLEPSVLSDNQALIPRRLLSPEIQSLGAYEQVVPSPEKVLDPVEAKESWSKLLARRVPPLCEHGEPCLSLVTKKPGVNCGMLRQ